MADVPDNEAEFSFDDARGFLVVPLKNEAFESALRAVQELAERDDLSEIEASEVRELFVYDPSRRPQPVPHSWLRDRLLLVGCGLVAFAIAMILFMGILAIAGLVPLPR